MAADAVPIPPDLLHSRLAVLDAVYRPAATRLMREALKRCAAVIPGTRMFVAQAAGQFELFTGRQAPVEVMTRALSEVPGCEWP
jgi:shikimate dehydrogenase